MRRTETIGADVFFFLYFLCPQQVIRVYSLPDGTFSSDEEDEEEEDEEDEEEEGEIQYLTLLLMLYLMLKKI